MAMWLIKICINDKKNSHKTIFIAVSFELVCERSYGHSFQRFPFVSFFFTDAFFVGHK